MDFDSSDDEPEVLYEDYRYTPTTDPFEVNLLWEEHFKRPVKYRNTEVTKAFETECSIHQFMYPDLTRYEVITRVKKELQAKSQKSKKKTFKDHIESNLCFKLTKSNQFNDEWEIIPDLNKKRDRSQETRISNKTIRVGLPQSANEKKAEHPKCIEEKFIDFKETDKIYPKKPAIISKKPKERKESSVKQYKRRSTGKPSANSSTISEFNKDFVETKVSSDLKGVLEIVNLNELNENTRGDKDQDEVTVQPCSSYKDNNKRDEEIKEINIKAIKEKKIIVKEINVESTLAKIQRKDKDQTRKGSDCYRGIKTKPFIINIIPLKITKVPVSSPMKLVPLNLPETNATSTTTAVHTENTDLNKLPPNKKKTMVFKVVKTCKKNT